MSRHGISELFTWYLRSVAASINLQSDYWRQAARPSSSFYWQARRKLKPGLNWLVLYLFIIRGNPVWIRDRPRHACSRFGSPESASEMKVELHLAEASGSKPNSGFGSYALLIITGPASLFPPVVLTVNSGSGLESLNFYWISTTGSSWSQDEYD